MRLDLSNVTICAIDTAAPNLAARALGISMDMCDFGDAILFTDFPVIGKFRNIQIPKILSLKDYSRFVLHDLNQFINTDFLLVIQWDGYVINPDAWSYEFFNFDYIGAKWHWHEDGMKVGNGGFSLRSKKLLNAIDVIGYTDSVGMNEDTVICKVLRPLLADRFAISFPNEDVADLFSYENFLPKNPTFGFHGLHNLWRHIDDSEMYLLVDQFSPHQYLTGGFIQLQGWYFAQQKYQLFSKLFSLTKKESLGNNLEQLYKNTYPDMGFVSRMIEYGLRTYVSI